MPLILLICFGLFAYWVFTLVSSAGEEKGREKERGKSVEEMFQQGFDCSTRKKYEAAVSWYYSAASSGHATAMNNLAVCHSMGNGVPKNEEMAFGWFKSAAEAGSAVGMFNLSTRYEHGIGTERDLRMARIWCEKAAQAGNADAKEKIDQMHDRMWAERAERGSEPGYPSDEIPF